MPFQFDNYARQVGSREDYEWFEWQVFMDEPPATLETVRGVEYRLHETFPDLIRTSEDAKRQFAIESSGWGEFTIFITIYLQDGAEERTEYSLDLSRPWPEAAVLGGPRPMAGASGRRRFKSCPRHSRGPGNGAFLFFSLGLAPSVGERLLARPVVGG